MPDHIADANKKVQPAPEPLCGGDESSGCAYHCGDPECAQNQPAPASFIIHGDEELSDERGNGLNIATAGPGAFKPAPAPLPEEVKESIEHLKDQLRRENEILSCTDEEGWPTVRYTAVQDVLGHVDHLTRRLAEAEAERDAAEAKATRVCRSMLRVGKRLRIARNRVRGIGEELLCARERVGCPASVLFQLCDMRKALGLDLIKTCYTEILPAIQDVVIRAESAEARVRELERALSDEQQDHQQTTRVMAERVRELEAALRGCKAFKDEADAERNALQNGLKRIIEEGSYDGAYPGERILVNLAQSALAATEVK